MSRNWDFSGWATKANIRCSDGRTILPNAFSGCDGMTVPLVWNHQHNDPSEVLGHALLENRGNGVYAYCSFNDNAKGREAKELVKHGDIKALSIYANNLVQSSKVPPCDVVHGTIREVSLVLAGANIGAFIDNVMAHGDVDETEAEIFHGDYDDDFILYHADEDEEDEDDEDMSSGKSAKDILSDLSPEQKAAVGVLLDEVMSHSATDDDDEDEDDYEEVDEDEEESDDEDEDSEDEDEDDEDEDDEAKHSEDLELVADAIIHAAITGEELDDYVTDIIEHMDYDQQMMIGDILNETAQHALEDEEDDYIAHRNEDYEDDEMKYNVFEDYDNYEPTITHADEEAVFELAKKVGSLKHAVEMSCQEGGVLCHAITDHNGDTINYGVANIDYLFPDAKSLNNPPEFINKPEEWVDKVINGTHHTPFSRVKSMFADLSGEDARARGYVKGKRKVEEVIETLKRETFPQTIYKKQKLDRDDIIDITDFDVVAWLKAEMQLMLKAEIARAILIGDGRQAGDDKIKEANVRPIYNDDDLFTIKVPVDVANGATNNVKAAAIIDAVILSRKDYKGSGNPSFFIDENYLGQMLILKDGMGRRIYETEASLAAALRVKELIPVDVMENKQIAIKTGQGDATVNKPLIGIIVNLQDYNVGADKGGQTSFFDDFDIDYNQFKYLYETRMSGALIKPFSAMSIYMNEASA